MKWLIVRWMLSVGFAGVLLRAEIIGLNLCAEPIASDPIASQPIYSITDQILSESVGAGCNQEFKAVISTEALEYSLRDSERTSSHVLPLYNIESDAEICAGRIAKIAALPERVTRILVQFDRECGGDQVVVPADEIRQDSTGMKLLVHLSEIWLGSKRVGCNALLVVDSFPTADFVLGGDNLSSSRITVGRPLLLTGIPPVSTNVNNAADSNGNEVAACSASISYNPAYGSNLGFLVGAFFLLLALTRSKMGVMRE